MPVLPRPCTPRRNPPRSRSADHRHSSHKKRNSTPEQPTGGGPKLVCEPPRPALPSTVKTGRGPVLDYQYPAVNTSKSSVRPSSTKITATEPSPTAGSKDQEPMSCCIMDRIEKKYSESSSQLNGQHLYIVLCFQSAVATILFLVFLCVPVAMISIGALNFSNCKLNDAIPLTLTVAGCAYFLIPLLSAALDWNANNRYCPVIVSLLVIVALGASTAGALVVFREVWPSAEPGDSRYCHPTLYYFSFVMWSTFIVFVPVMLVVSVVVFRRFGRHNVNAVRPS
ncbi:uncharacterized protein LOC121047498 [Ixodes scapularis]|uniref:uncharacterized protein LOC121047498 n=1 Tax=Ixodes scapularis TaxID=6945 RepID=UPI001AD7E17B|nr:uncharacterized protein LOC121047498 [Ixodes scapularis]